jgi:CRISPR/Cas system CMR-associated protein Cmr5 small subunit
MSDDNTEDLASNKLRGVRKIAEFIGEDDRRTAYLIERDLIPYAKEGRAVISFKSWLRRHYANLRSNTTDPEIPSSAA